jgi:uncharacterized protein (TIGR03086 family)
MSTETIANVFAGTRRVLSNVRPDQLAQPTPCASWDVRRLINHIVGGSHWFAITANAGAAPEVDDTEDTDYTAGDMVASYDDGISESLAAFGAPGAEEKMVKLPFGEFPGAVFLAFATIDHFTHGWDLAKATGQPTDLDSEIALQLLDQAQMMVPDQFRGPDGVAPFGPIVDAPVSARAADRLAAFLGRTP